MIGRAASTLLVALVCGCSGGDSGSALSVTGAEHDATSRAVGRSAGANAVANPGFESGSLASCASCRTVDTSAVSITQAHTGSYSALIGSADVLSTSGSPLAQLYREANTTGGWVQKTFALSAYEGQTVQLYFGIKGNGYSKDYIYEYLDDVSLTGSGATSPPSASPSAAPSSPPSAAPTGREMFEILVTETQSFYPRRVPSIRRLNDYGVLLGSCAGST